MTASEKCNADCSSLQQWAYRKIGYRKYQKTMAKNPFWIKYQNGLEK